MRGSGGRANPSHLKDAAPETLAALRAEIDALDDALHDALMRRAAVVERLARSGAKPREAVLRPGREAAILRRLLARHAGALPKRALVRLWREVFSSSLAQQTGFSVASDAAALPLALDHFGPAVPLRAAADPLAELEAGAASVAAMPWPGAWWATLDPGRAFVVALLPFWRDGEGAEAALLALAPADASGRDLTLVRAERAPPGGTPLARHANLTLAAVRGYIPAGDPRLAGLDLVGHSALPENA